MKKTSRELYLEWIADNYSELVSRASNIVGEYLAGDLVNDLYISSYNKESINDNIIENHKELVYFLISMKKEKQMNDRNKKDINAELLKYYTDDLNLDDLNNDKYLEVFNTLEMLHKNKKITWYQFKLFKLFYYTEDYYDITDLNTDAVNKLRKLTLRKLADDIGIAYSSILYSLNKTKIVLKVELNKENYEK